MVQFKVSLGLPPQARTKLLCRPTDSSSLSTTGIAPLIRKRLLTKKTLQNKWIRAPEGAQPKSIEQNDICQGVKQALRAP